MIDLIGEILLFIEDLKFWKKKKVRRKYEKENNLPEKLMIHPFLKFFLLGMGFIIFARIIIGYFYLNDLGNKKTKEKISKIENILQKEKNENGKYPKKLELIIRNNPLRKNITIDYWKNEFYYSQLDNGESYELISAGKDGIKNTNDDIRAD